MLDRTTPVIVTNSPIDFVISGPVGGRDRILVRSQNASLDLVALSAQSSDIERRRPSSDPFVALFGGTARQLNVVSSMTVPDFRKDADTRLSSLRFAWIGLASPMRVERIREAFNKSLPELLRAMESNVEEDIEFNIAPVVLACSEAHEQRRRTHRALYTILALYALIGVAVIGYSLLKGNLLM
jgi:hypothetical protein